MKKLFFILFYVFNFLHSQNIYLSPSGKDSNKGTYKEPFYSLEKAFLSARTYPNEPVIIRIASGSYFINKELAIDINDSRKDNCPITVIGDSANPPILYGAKRLRPILNIKSGHWELDVSKIPNSDKLRQFLSINGKMIKSSQYPKSGFANPVKVNYTQNQEAIITISDELDTILKKCTAQQVKHIQVTVFVSWGSIIRYIKEYNPINKTITVDAPYGFAPYDIKTTTLMRFNNVPNILLRGEWYYKDESTIAYLPLNKEKIENSEILIPVIDRFMDIVGTENKKVSNINFKNIAFRVAGESLSATGYSPDQAAMNVDAVIKLNFADKINFEGVYFSNISSNAIWFQKACSASSVTQSQFTNLGAGGVKIGLMDDIPYASISNNITIDNNILKTGGLIYPGAVPIIIFKAFSNKITHNDISDFIYTGISVGWVWGYGNSPSKNNLIAYNHIYNLGKGQLDDMGGIYTLGRSEGTVIKNNLIHDINSNNYGGWGIYTDAGSSNILIENNVVYSCNSAGYHHNYGQNNTITNNIFAYNGKAELEATVIENHNSFEFTHNIVVHKNNNFFGSNWVFINQKNNNNIYYSLRGSESITKTIGAGNVALNPNLQKKDAYFEIINTEAIKKINFKPVDYYRIGAIKKENR